MAVIINFCLFFFFLSSTYLKINHCTKMEPSPKLTLDENNFLSEIRNFITVLKSNPDIIYNEIYMNDTIKNFAEKYNITFINPMIDNFLFNKKCSFINDSFEIISKNYSNMNVLDYILNILDYIEENNKINMSIIFYELHKYVNYPGMDKLFNQYKKYSNFTFLFLEKTMNTTKFPYLFEYIHDLLIGFNDILFQFSYDFFKFYNDTYKLAEIGEKLFKNNEMFKNAFEFKLDLPQFKEISKLIHFSSSIFEAIKIKFLSEYSSTNILFFLIYYKKTNFFYFELIKNWGDEKAFFKFLPEIIRNMLDLREEDRNFDYYLSYITLDWIEKAIMERMTKDIYLKLVTDNLMKKVNNFFIEEGLINNDLSVDCKYLIKNTFFSNFTYTSAFFIKKLVIDSTKNKNDFLTYENCIEYKNFPEIENLNFTVQPIFVIGIIDDIITKNRFKNSSLNEKYNYLNSFCLPYGLYKEEKDGNKEMCNNEDYNKIMNATLRFFFDMNTSIINTINIYDNKYTSLQYFFGSLSLIIILFPFLINLFLFIYENINIGNYEKSKKLIYPQNNFDSNSKNDRLIQKKYNHPNWFKYLSIFFNIKNNIMELFEFNLNQTNFNNYHGITYIKGILGISMILYILGQIYLVLINYPSKIISQFVFYNFIYNPIYSILFFCLRYSPRIILSCNGYILAFKFLNFIGKQKRYYLLKFLFLQSYKYMLLIFAVIFMRYCLYLIDATLTQRRHPLMEIYQYNLKDNDNYYFGGLFSFLLYNSGNYSFKNRQNLIQYFYLPLNESFLFIFGIIMISLGYKFKLRIDYIIIILGFSIYILKIILYCFYFYNKEYFSTLYYYLYDYGELMLNPIFNIPYYLIGIYFGLINFSVQKGISIHKLDRLESYAIIEMLGIYQNPSIDEDNNIEGNNKKTNYIKVNDKVIEFNDLGLDLESEGRKSYETISSKDIEEKSELNKSYQSKMKKKKINKFKKKENKTYEIKNKENKDINIETKELDDKIKEMPFLQSPINFLNFHQRINIRFLLRIIIFICISFILFSMFFHMIIIFITNKEKEDKNTEFISFSLEDMISNYGLNIFYLFDIELVVFIINWIFFIFYSRSGKTADIIDFVNNNYWLFFIKSYFSFTVISTPIIIYVFYQSETVIELNMGNIFLYFSLNFIFILLGNIFFYGCFEFPFKKIFKSCFDREKIINIENEDQKENEDDIEADNNKEDEV